jgi:hypothetical protein
MRLRATNDTQCVYGNMDSLAPYIAMGWDVEEYVVGLGWIMA